MPQQSGHNPSRAKPHHPFQKKNFYFGCRTGLEQKDRWVYAFPDYVISRSIYVWASASCCLHFLLRHDVERKKASHSIMKELWKWDLSWIVKIYSTKFWFLSPDLWVLCSPHLKASGNQAVVFSTLRGRRLTQIRRHSICLIAEIDHFDSQPNGPSRYLWKFESPRFDDVFASKPISSPKTERKQFENIRQRSATLEWVSWTGSAYALNCKTFFNRSSISSTHSETRGEWKWKIIVNNWKLWMLFWKEKKF